MADSPDLMRRRLPRLSLNRKDFKIGKERSRASPKTPVKEIINLETNNAGFDTTTENNLCSTPLNNKRKFIDYDDSPSQTCDFSPTSIISQEDNFHKADVTWRWDEKSTTRQTSKIQPSRKTSIRVREMKKERAQKLEFKKFEKHKSNEVTGFHKFLKDFETEHQIKLSNEKKKLDVIELDSSGKENSVHNLEVGQKKEIKALSPIRCEQNQLFDSLKTSIVSNSNSNKVKNCISKTNDEKNNSNCNVIDLLDDTDSDIFLIEASQQVEQKVSQEKPVNDRFNVPTKTPETNRTESSCHLLQDSFDDCLTLLANEKEKDIFRPSTSGYSSMSTKNALGRHNTMPYHSLQSSKTFKRHSSTNSLTAAKKTSDTTSQDTPNIQKIIQGKKEEALRKLHLSRQRKFGNIANNNNK